MDQSAVPARALPEHAPASVAAAAEALLDVGHHLADEECLPGSHGGAVHILVAAKAREAIGKGDHDRGHLACSDQAVEALGNVLAVILPVGVGRSARRIADEIHQEGEPAPVMACGHIDIDPATGGIAEQIALKAPAVDPDLVHRAFRRLVILAHRHPRSSQAKTVWRRSRNSPESGLLRR
jgi:hypothetical protein